MEYNYALGMDLYGIGEEQYIPGWWYWFGLQFSVARILPRVKPALSYPSI